MQRGRKSVSALATTVSVDGRATALRPPASLSDAERSIWVHTVTAVRPEHFRPCDEPLLMRFCEVSAACDHAAEKFRCRYRQRPDAVAVAVHTGTADKIVGRAVPSVASQPVGEDTAQERQAGSG